MSPENRKTWMIIFVACLALFYYNKRTVENFTFGKIITSQSDYISDVRNVVGTVGPYVGDVYSYLRNKYSQPGSTNVAPVAYRPQSKTDPTLNDPFLPIARTQIKAWINSSRAQWQKKYPVIDLLDWRKKFDLNYDEDPVTNQIAVTHVYDGKATEYIV